MSLKCAISGEPLTSSDDNNNNEEIVVTPSGHICLKRLILTKLSENGGLDPFSDSGRPLSEDDLVTLQQSPQNNNSSSNMPPPPSSVSTFSGTLQQLAKEYDSVVLELFDTRKALQETRRELSQALYQNDAAIRVLARVSMERDTARQEAQQFQAAAGTLNGNNANNSVDAGAPSKKKPRLDEDADLPLTNDIPSSDLDLMLGAWDKLHSGRRSKTKTSYTLPKDWKVINSKSWHKSTCRGLTAISSCGSNNQWIVTAGKDKQIIVYDSKSEVVGATFSPKRIITSLDVAYKNGSGAEDADALLVFAVCDQQDLILYDTTDPDKEKIVKATDLDIGGGGNEDDAIVIALGHPTGKHCCAATKSGKVILFRIPEGDIEKVRHVSTFSAPSEENEGRVEFSCGAMHPDGLLFAAGTTNGLIQLWDLKNKQVGGTFKLPDDKEDAAVFICFSSNGYHFASCHTSGTVRLWDMRKNKLVTEMNVGSDGDVLESVQSIAFHPNGKFMAYAGSGGIHITAVKEWKVSATLDVKDASGVVWDTQWIAATSGSERAVTFHSGDSK